MNHLIHIEDYFWKHHIVMKYIQIHTPQFIRRLNQARLLGLDASGNTF